VWRFTPGIPEWGSERHFVEVDDAAPVAEKLDSGLVAIDGRSQAEYDAGHIEGALPLDRVGEVEVSTQLVLYGEGGRDGDLVETAITLEEAGYLVYLYTGGLADWVASGGATEQTP
jgi:rhodanese-related sulfurtransferase